MMTVRSPLSDGDLFFVSPRVLPKVTVMTVSFRDLVKIFETSKLSENLKKFQTPNFEIRTALILRLYIKSDIFQTSKNLVKIDIQFFNYADYHNAKSA